MSWFQNLIVMPIVIGYLVQLLIKPRPGNTIDEMPKIQQNWFNSGAYMNINGHNMFYKTYEFSGEESLSNPPTIVLVHGYPSSSFDYHKVDITELTKFGSVLMYDHIGFGFSDKPKKDFTYSIFELADYSIMLYKRLGLTNIILIAHDMGDTVTAEILKRKDRGILDESLNIHGAAFTNGGINFKYAKLRLAQWGLRLPFGIGEGINRLFIIIAEHIPALESKTYHEIAGSNQLLTERIQDINHFHAMNRFNDGHLILWKTIFYLNDRDNFEYSWHESFSRIDFPVFVVWGDDDTVAPAKIGTSITKIIRGAQHRSKAGVGHFLMLEDAQFWTESMVQFLTEVKNSYPKSVQ